MERFLVAGGHDFSSRADSWFSGLRHPCAGRHTGKRSPDVEAVRLRDATLCVSREGFLVTGPSGGTVAFATSKPGVCTPDTMRGLPERARLDGLFFDGDPHRGNNTNYCIWLTDHMPRICWARELFPELPLGLHCHGLNGFQWASLAAAGVPFAETTPIELREGTYRVGDLAFLTSSAGAFLSRLQGGSRSYAAALTARLGYRGQKRSRKLFVTRPPDTRRTLIDYESHVSFLASQGFQIVDPGLLPFSQQVPLFAEATHVVGIHGAALANLLFCAPGTPVMEIFPKDYGTRAFVWISDVKDLAYHPFIAEAPGEKPSTAQEAFFQDVVLPAEGFRQSIEDFLSAPVPSPAA